jgi:hypothetical protein
VTGRTTPLPSTMLGLNTDQCSFQVTHLDPLNLVLGIRSPVPSSPPFYSPMTLPLKWWRNITRNIMGPSRISLGNRLGASCFPVLTSTYFSCLREGAHLSKNVQSNPSVLLGIWLRQFHVFPLLILHFSVCIQPLPPSICYTF